jgi:hypothetical protein
MAKAHLGARPGLHKPGRGWMGWTTGRACSGVASRGLRRARGGRDT